MKISQVRFHLCRQALQRPIPLSCGVLSHRNFGLIEIETDAGITGWGETSINFPPWAAVERKATIEQGLVPMLLGRDPLEIDRLNRDMHQGTRGFTRMWAQGAIVQAISGIDLALWDIAGKEYGVPVWKLLGGNYRNEVPLYATGMRTDDIAAGALEAVAAGYRTVKVRTGFEDSKDIENVRRVRDAIGPDIGLMIDANQAYDLPRARRVLRQLASVQPYWVEEPVLNDDLVAWRQLRAEFPQIPLAWGENAFSLQDYAAMGQPMLVDYVMPDPCRSGGLSQTVRMARHAYDQGIPISPHHYGSDVGFVACLHLVASQPNFSLMLRDVADVSLRDNIIEQPLEIRAGVVAVPQTPGMGVDINHALLEQTRVKL
ncbi:MAG: mandelate racemase/muconate lactonizing enzyme family protein [Rubrivivax sp.]|nr:mandelate racemase/muconate lactonizing enzyme family protein [Rubrivivax sp.]